MSNPTATTSKIDQLPQDARDRIHQLRLLFVERSKGHLIQVRQLLDARQVSSDTRAVDAELMKLSHSLVGASGLFGFQDLGNAAFKVESTLRELDYREADFARVAAELVEQLTMLD